MTFMCRILRYKLKILLNLKQSVTILFLSQDSVAKVRGQLTQAQQYQDQLRAFEARDRNTAESNFSRVNFWSIIHLVCLLLTGFVQVVMLKSLFDEKSAIRRVWKQSGM